jgi:hypothetical protein
VIEYKGQRKEKLLMQIEGGIDEHQFYVIHVHPAKPDAGDQFSYTIGLESSFGHPELICFGLGSVLVHSLFTDVVGRIRRGEIVPLNQRVGRIVRSLDVMFKPAEARCSSLYLRQAVEYYKDDQFRTVVMLWPDRHNRLPVDDEYTQLDKQRCVKSIITSETVEAFHQRRLKKHH